MLKLISKEMRYANKIKGLLLRKGFIVKTQMSKNTKSVYLKIDNGACGVIRISDHRNPKSAFKFNVIRDYKGRKRERINGKVVYYYNFNNISRLLADLELERSDKVIKYGYSNYRKIRDKVNAINNNEYLEKVA